MEDVMAGTTEPGLPRIAVTMGDPAGIGPEIIVKALSGPEVRRKCRPVVFGDLSWMRRAAKGIPGAAWPTAESPGEQPERDELLQVRQATEADLSGVVWGRLSAEAGKAAVESVIAATKATLAGEFDAIVTAPLNKEAIALAGFPYPGHTELLAAITNTQRYGMLLISGPLRAVHVSTHVSLKEAIERVTPSRVLQCILMGKRACANLGIPNARIAVAGLNPHAGEHGMFGTEEAEAISPAIAAAAAQGIAVSGPYPPDTVFARAAQGEFDLVVAMYHDQGHIPVKLNGFDTGVNVTIGLPVLRVSVDHGTAFDIAGQGTAREQSLLEAFRVAVQLAETKR